MIINRVLSVRPHVLALLFTLATCNSFAQDKLSESDYSSSSRSATAITTKPPTYPQQELQKGGEGMVLISFIVDEEGNVQNAMIEDAIGGESFEKASLKAVKRFKFEPALQDGQAISQSMTRYQMSFAIEDQVGGASRKFINTYTELMNLIESEEIHKDDLMNKLIELKYSNVNNLYEYAWYGWLEYNYLAKYEVENKVGIINSLLAATRTKEKNSYDQNRTGSRIKATKNNFDESTIYLPHDTFTFALRQLFVEYLKANEFSSALASFNKLINTSPIEESVFYEETINTLSPLYDQIIEQIDSNNTYALKGKISEHDYWILELLRNSFSIENIEGTLKTIDLRCTARNVRLDFVANQVFTIPESWGLCSLYLEGESGTTFSFYSIPSTAL